MQRCSSPLIAGNVFAEQVHDARRLKTHSAGLPGAVQRNGRCIIDIRLPKIYSICDPVWGWRGTVMYHHILRRLRAERLEREQQMQLAAIENGTAASVDPEVQALANFANASSDQLVSAPQPTASAAAAARMPASQRFSRHDSSLDDAAHAQHMNAPIRPEALCCFLAFPCMWCGPLPDESVCLCSATGGCQRTIGTMSFWMGAASTVMFILACILDDEVRASLQNEALPTVVRTHELTFNEVMTGVPAGYLINTGAFVASPASDGVVEDVWRFLSALLLPSCLLHLLLHLAVLWRVGALLEHLWSTPRFMLVYLGGALMSLLFEASIFKPTYAVEGGVIAACSYGDMAMLATWLLYLSAESSVQHKQQRSGALIMICLFLYASLLVGLCYLFPHMGSGVAVPCAILLFAPAIYVLAFNSLNLYQKVSFGTSRDLLLRATPGPGLHLIVPNGASSAVRAARRGASRLHQGEPSHTEQEDRETSGLFGGRDPARERRHTKPALCEECVFVCPGAVRSCGCHRVWGLPTVLSALYLLICVLTMLGVALAW